MPQDYAVPPPVRIRLSRIALAVSLILLSTALLSAQVPDLTIGSTHNGSFVIGQTGATYTLTVTNSGNSATAGTVTVSESLPSQLRATAFAGSGWSCTVSPLKCTRADVLAASGSYPDVTLTVTVGTTYIGTVNAIATVSGGGETNNSNDTAADSTNIVAPDLTIASTHSGIFISGQTGVTYTLTVTNIGGGPTNGRAVSATEQSAPIVITAMAGPGWSCNPVTCTRSDVLAAGSSYPAITVTGNAPGNASGTVANNVAVSGGGEYNTSNDTASDPTTFILPPQLSIASSHWGSFTDGQTGNYVLTVNNPYYFSSPPTSGTVTVTDTLPSTLSATAISGSGWTCALSTITCTRSDVLASPGTYPQITIAVNVGLNTPARVTNTAAVSGGGAGWIGNSTTDPTAVTAVADMTVVASHAGNWVQGQIGATYSIEVTNSGGAATSGFVGVGPLGTYGLPPATTATAIGGSGWNCGFTVNGSTQSVGCNRTDALAAGSSYPPITVTLNLAANAVSFMNEVGVNGGGETNYSDDFSCDAITIQTPPAATLLSISPTSGYPGLSVPVTLTGSNFVFGAFISAGNGITVSNLSVGSSTQITATLNIPSNAEGPASVTVNTVGGPSGALAFTVNLPVTVTVTPATATVAVSKMQQFMATVSNTSNTGVAWSLSPNRGTIDSSGLYTAPISVASQQTVTVTATSAVDTTKSASATVTVNPLPNISIVSPMSATAGVQITVSGSGFGSTQGTGAVWLGSTPGTVVTWSSTQIVATVASNAVSGSAYVQQWGLLSNLIMPFTVSTPTITGVTPALAAPGALVTITGSGFGASQGTGQVWLGGAIAAIQSWNDGQIVAQVPAGTTGAGARVVQNGVMSSAGTFTVDALQLLSVTAVPNSSAFTFTGAGFGSQGTGAVWLGDRAGNVVSWTDTQVVATPGFSANSGVAKIQQNGVWSNAKPFIVAVPGGGGNTVVPSALNLVVGDTRSIQALNSSSQPVTGLTWTSSNPNVVSLSADDPPILTAVAAGNVTISAGTGSADVTVYAESLPLGTVIWSNPGAGSGVSWIVPAVPSSTGVADVFAIQNDGTVQAIASHGTTAWTADLGASGVDYRFPQNVMPDFQGGLILTSGTQIWKLDGITGQANHKYTATGYLGAVPSVVHPDGTIFALDGSSIVGIDSTNGAATFSIAIPAKVEVVYSPIIAGDGCAYFPYSYISNISSEVYIRQLAMLRISSSGASENIDVAQYVGGTGELVDMGVSTVTNADQGVLLTWSTPYPIISTYMATITGTTVSIVNAPLVPGAFQVSPTLQAQDGSFVGEYTDGNDGAQNMVAFDASGNVRWIVPNEQPQIATADGGVIGQSGITYDANGNATGQLGSLPTQSWRGNAYVDGDVEQIFLKLFMRATTWWAQRGSNPSRSSTAARPWSFTISWQNQFDFIPAFPNYLPNLNTDITSASAQITTVALKALKAAYEPWPVIVAESIPSLGDHRAVVQTSIPGSACGITDPNFPYTSTIPYECNMEQAQIALQISITNVQAETAAIGNLSLIQAIGRGIGNNAAHEIAHQFLGLCCSMDVSTSADPNAAATYNNGDGSGDPNPSDTNSDPAPYTGFGKNGTTPIHWENTTLQALQKCLSNRYQNFPGNCATALNLARNQGGVASPRGAMAKSFEPEKTETLERLLLPGILLCVEAILGWF